MGGSRAGRNFQLLWLGRAVAAFGTQLRVLIFPLLAVHLLGAGTVEIGLLNAAASVAFLLVGLPAGPLVDALPKQRLLIVMLLGQALLLGWLILAGRVGALALPQLYLVALLLGIAGVVSGVAFLSLIPEAVPEHRVVSLTSRVTVVQTLAQVTGPAAGGVLIAVLGPVNPLGIAAGCLLLATGCLAGLRVTAAASATTAREPTRRSIVEGLAYVRSQPLIRRITLSAATDAGFGAVWQAALVVYLVQQLRASDVQVGLVFAIAATGGVLAAAVAPRIIDRWGQAAALRWWLPASNLAGPLMVLATPGWGVFLVAGADFVMMAGAIVFNVTQTSARLRVCPKPLLGRMNATIRTAVWSASAVGSLAGAGLGLLLDPQWVVLAGVVAVVIGTWLVCGSRPFPAAVSEPLPPGAPARP